MNTFLSFCSIIGFLFATTNLQQSGHRSIKQDFILYQPKKSADISLSFADKIVNSGCPFSGLFESDDTLPRLQVCDKSDDLIVTLSENQSGKLSTCIITPGKQGEYYASFVKKPLLGLEAPQHETIDLYVYSDGIHDCLSTSSRDEARSEYYLNYIATEEDLFLLGRNINIPNVRLTKTKLQAEKEYAEFVYEGEDISSDSTIKSLDLNYKIRVKGHTIWYDETNNPHPLKGVSVKVLDDDLIWDDCCAEGYTDENGDFSFLIDNQILFELGSSDIFVALFAETKAVEVQGLGGRYLYTTNVYRNVSFNKEIEYSIEMRPGLSNRAAAFEICQAENIPYEYVKAMSGITMPIIKVLYPGFENNSCYFYNDRNFMHIGVGQEYHRDWDCLNHEYGHYINKYLSLCETNVYGYHRVNEDLIDSRGKINGMKMAMSEGLATYLGIASQMYYASSWNIPRVGDEEYFSLNGVHDRYNLVKYGTSDQSFAYGEGNESSIASLLIKLLDNVGGRIYDKVAIGHQAMWDIIRSKNHWYISSLISDLLNEYPHLQNDIAHLLEVECFSSTLMKSSHTLSTNPNSECWTYSWKNDSNAVGNSNMFDLLFKGVNETVEIKNIQSNSYTLTDQEKNEVLNLPGSVIHYNVVGYNIDSQITGGYPSPTLSVNKPSLTVIDSGISHSSSLNSGGTKWYEFTAQETSTYTFETTGQVDTFGEIFPSVVIDSSSYGVMFYNNDGGENRNFKIIAPLSAGQKVYLRVSGNVSSATGSFSLTVSHEHIHNYCQYYQQFSSKKHRAFCLCGDYILKNHESNGISYQVGTHNYTTCEHCGQEIDMNSGGIVIGN